MQQQTLKLNEICEIITSPVDKKSYKDETPVLLCNYTDVYYNEFITKNINFMEATASDNEIKKYSLYKGDVVITKDSETPDDIGISTYIAEDIENLVCGYHLAILRPNTKYVNGLYLAYYLKLQQVLNIFGRFANGITRYSLINATYKAIPVLLPPLAEQEKIAEILSLWDKAIEQTKELITYKEKQKKGLMQNLLTGKKRLHGFTDKWKTVKLGDIFKITSAGVDKKILEHEIKINLLNYMDIYNNNLISNKIINFMTSAPKNKILNCNILKGDVFLTPSSETRDDIAHSSVAIEDLQDTVYSYHIVRLRPKEQINLLFSKYMFDNDFFRKQAYSLCEGSGQRYVLSLSILNHLKLKIPTSLDEQEAIADILCKADEEIELLNKQLDLYTEQKKGLMQNLLTGKVRVTV